MSDRRKQSNTPQQWLDKATALTRRMTELGAAGQWDEVAEVEAQRQACLTQAFDKRLLLNERLERQIREIHDMDQELLVLSKRARDALGAELTDLQRGRKVRKAYRSSDGS